MDDRTHRRLTAAEARVEAGVVKAFRWLAGYSVAQLEAADWDQNVLDVRWLAWSAKVAELIEPRVHAVYAAAYDRPLTAATVNAMTAADDYIDRIHNRMVGTGDDVFDLIRKELNEGRATGESIPKLAARVDETLRTTGTATWRNRGRTVARTEVIGAHNAGHHDAAISHTEALGERPGDVAKEWVARLDDRVRETHAAADGDIVIGLATPFLVGGMAMQYPGDPAGGASEVINCRCTVNYLYPDDPGYPITAGGDMATTAAEPETRQEEDQPDAAHDGALLVGLPASDDPANGIGDEEKHVTLTWFGETGENPDLDLGAIGAAVDAAAATLPAAFDNDVDGVGSLGDDGARVWMLSGDGPVVGLRDALMGLDVVAAAVGAVEQYPDFTPHVTIGYPAEGSEELDPAVEEEAVAVDSIGFDRIALWVGDDHSQTWDLPTGEAEAPDGAAPDDGGEEASANTAAFAEAGPALAQDIPPDGEPWFAIFAPEDVLSGDGRRFGIGSLTWRDLPLPLKYQEADAIGHDGSVRVGRIDTIERDEASYDKPMIRATGVWDTSETAQEAKRQVDVRMLRGVSVDCDNYVSEFVDPDGNPVDMDELFFMAMDGEEMPVIIEQASEARIAAATLCSIPAFQQGYIASGVRDPSAEEPGMGDLDAPPPGTREPVTAAAAWTLAAPEVLPHSLFERPECLDDGLTALTMDGAHIYGHLAQWGTCHIGREGVCVVPPHSASGYLYFATGVVETDGGLVPVGQITMDTGHAADGARWRAAAAHYDNTGYAVADVTIGEDETGIWYSGMIRPDADPVKVRNLRATGCLSGDWRDTGGPDLELVAALGVNVPGFSVPRLTLAASGGRQTSLVASGIVTPHTMAQRTADAAEPGAVAREVLAILDRRTRRDRVKRRIGRDAASRRAAARRTIAALRQTGE